MGEALLQVRDLSVDVVGEQRRIVPEISFEIARGEIVGLCGRSGAGKTTLARALPQLLPRDRFRVGGSVRFEGRELTGVSERSLGSVRGARMAMMFQEPLLALNPFLRVATQLREVLAAHGCAGDPAALLRQVGLEPTPRILVAYPHQLSGGERQRVALAQALACRPALVIADEPFTALDAPRQLELCRLFRQLSTELQTSFLLISHSAGVLRAIATRVLSVGEPAGPASRPAPNKPELTELVLNVNGVRKCYQTEALRGASLTLQRGHILALAGASGSGKSTLARIIAGFETADSGAIERKGSVQLIVQEPAASLNPRFTAQQAIGEPLRIQRRPDNAEELAALVGLPRDLQRPVTAYSGGERQRIAIARALTLAPDVLLLDESLSGLDAATQDQLITLLHDLRARLGLAIVVISHDLTMIARLADEIAIMDAGQVVEQRPAAELLRDPHHPRTQALVAASRAIDHGELPA